VLPQRGQKNAKREGKIYRLGSHGRVSVPVRTTQGQDPGAREPGRKSASRQAPPESLLTGERGTRFPEEFLPDVSPGVAILGQRTRRRNEIRASQKVGHNTSRLPGLVVRILEPTLAGCQAPAGIESTTLHTEQAKLKETS